MKTKLIALLLVVSSISVFGQKKKNGTVYIDHPAIDIIYQMYDAVNTNNLEALDNLLSDDFKGVWGDEMNKDREPTTKKQFIDNIESWNTKNRYHSLKTANNAYPDAIKYNDENFKDVTLVYCWEAISGVGGMTGVKFSQRRHTQYAVNSDNKISFSRTYMNQMPFVESWRSRSNLSDGKIYSNHPNINTVRKAMHALQYGNMDHFFEAFDENAKFDGLFSDWDADDLSIDEFKNMQTEFLNNYSIESVDNRGIKYYEFDSQKGLVQSWWRISLVRKSDNKAIVLPVMVNHRFNDEGKIVKSFEAWNGDKL
ncbi:MAG: hypothetical protein P8H44_01690 [Flavobacteriaceae bacterium]|jgi:hypothetical protein|nr:hypothetical protein [Flavobacteriaceae bacterium]MDG1793244.1 hypothetical protein [Flavobacteriaceae bacterium]